MPDPFYYSKPWRAFRAAMLRDHPHCFVVGCRIPASHVDHIISRRRGGAPLDRRNARCYCEPHHNAKTARLDQPGRAASAKPLLAFGCGPDGWPYWRS